MSRTAPVSALLALGVLVALPSGSQPFYVGHLEKERSSPGGEVTARYVFDDGVARVELLRGEEWLGTVEVGDSSSCPGWFAVFDDATLVTANSCLRDRDGRDEVLTAYDPDGTVRWTRTLRELVPATAGLVLRNIDGPDSWFADIHLEGSAPRSEERIRITLLSYDQLVVDPFDGSVERREVPTAALGDDPAALLGRASFLRETGEGEQSAALLRRVLELNPRSFDATRNLAGYLSGRGRFEEAAEVWRRLDDQALGPDVPVTLIGGARFARYERVRALIRAEAYSEALDAVSAALREQPSNTSYELLLAELHLRLGDPDRASALFDELLRRKERQVKAGVLLMDEFGSDAAGIQEMANRIAALFQETGHAELAERYREVGRQRGLALWKQAPPPERSMDTYRRSRALLEAGALDEAIAAYGSPDAMDAEFLELLGAIYLRGGVAPRDLDAAQRWFRRAAERLPSSGSGGGGVYFALCYLERHAPEEPDFAAAARWCERAAAAGHAGGSFWLGVLRASGRGVERDPEAAAELLRAARDGGYLRGDLSARRVDERYSVHTSYRADAYFSSPAMVPDFQWAAQVLEPLAKRGVPIADAVLGRLYEGSYLGPLRNPERALSHYERAARKGDAPSMLRIARLAPGRPCDHDAWLARAAAAGEPEAQLEIAACHIRGGVAQPDLAAAEAALRAYTLQWYRDHPPPYYRLVVIENENEEGPAEDLYRELEKALGREVERPKPPSPGPNDTATAGGS